MKTHILLAALAWSFALRPASVTAPPSISVILTDDQGEGTFRNPVLNVDFPESDVSLQEERPMHLICRKSLSLVVAARGILFAETVK